MFAEAYDVSDDEGKRDTTHLSILRKLFAEQINPLFECEGETPPNIDTVVLDCSDDAYILRHNFEALPDTANLYELVELPRASILLLKTYKVLSVNEPIRTDLGMAVPVTPTIMKALAIDDSTQYYTFDLQTLRDAVTYGQIISQ